MPSSSIDMHLLSSARGNVATRFIPNPQEFPAVDELVAGAARIGGRCDAAISGEWKHGRHSSVGCVEGDKCVGGSCFGTVWTDHSGGYRQGPGQVAQTDQTIGGRE